MTGANNVIYNCCLYDIHSIVIKVLFRKNFDIYCKTKINFTVNKFH